MLHTDAVGYSRLSVAQTDLLISYIHSERANIFIWGHDSKPAVYECLVEYLVISCLALHHTINTT
jgi:hypothetical protein